MLFLLPLIIVLCRPFLRFIIEQDNILYLGMGVATVSATVENQSTNWNIYKERKNSHAYYILISA